MIEFKIADIGFAEELVKFWRVSFLQAYSEIHSNENIEAYFAQSYTTAEAQRILSDKHFICIKANREGKTVGIAIINHRRCPLKKELNASELKHLYLLSSEYGSGLAQEMVEKVFQISEDAGKSAVWLSVSKLNVRAQRFYQKLGFDLMGNGDDIKVGDELLPSLVMVKNSI